MSVKERTEGFVLGYNYRSVEVVYTDEILQKWSPDIIEKAGVLLDTMYELFSTFDNFEDGYISNQRKFFVNMSDSVIIQHIKDDDFYVEMFMDNFNKGDKELRYIDRPSSLVEEFFEYTYTKFIRDLEQVADDLCDWFNSLNTHNSEYILLKLEDKLGISIGEEEYLTESVQSVINSIKSKAQQLLSSIRHLIPKQKKTIELDKEQVKNCQDLLEILKKYAEIDEAVSLTKDTIQRASSNVAKNQSLLNNLIPILNKVIEHHQIAVDVLKELTEDIAQTLAFDGPEGLTDISNFDQSLVCISLVFLVNILFRKSYKSAFNFFY